MSYVVGGGVEMEEIEDFVCLGIVVEVCWFFGVIYVFFVGYFCFLFVLVWCVEMSIFDIIIENCLLFV